MRLALTRSRLIVVLAVIALLGVWWGVPTYRKAQADAYVDELCAKDGGTRVFEKVRLPPSQFDESGQMRVPSAAQRKSGDAFYYTTTRTSIRGEADSPNRLVIWRDQYQLYRVADGKKLAESVTYVRRGGDPQTWAHPSSHVCPHRMELESAVFFKE
jgi:hypothetical protein